MRSSRVRLTVRTMMIAWRPLPWFWPWNVSYIVLQRGARLCCRWGL